MKMFEKNLFSITYCYALTNCSVLYSFIVVLHSVLCKYVSEKVSVYIMHTYVYTLMYITPMCSCLLF